MQNEVKPYECVITHEDSEFTVDLSLPTPPLERYAVSVAGFGTLEDTDQDVYAVKDFQLFTVSLVSSDEYPCLPTIDIVPPIEYSTWDPYYDQTIKVGE